MADYLTTDTELTSVANAIRTKGGTSASLVYPTGFVTAIGNIDTAYPSADGVSFGTVASTITFTITGTTYQADSGMTWGQWVPSAYNTGGYYVLNNYVYYSTAKATYQVSYSNNTSVQASETIQSGTSYIHKWVSN